MDSLVSCGPRVPYSSDNLVFRLHYRVTVWLLFILGIILGIIHFTTDSIKCVGSSGHFNLTHIASEYCWNVATSMGVANIAGKDSTEDLKKYRLIFCRFLFHAIFFYLARLVWKTWNGVKIERIAKDLNQHVSAADESLKKRYLAGIAEYVKWQGSDNTADFIIFAACEVMNFVNVVVHLCLLDSQLGNILSTYGLNVIGLTNSAEIIRDDSLLTAFPRLIKCRIEAYGASGDLQLHHQACVLPNNSFYEKVVAFVLVWFVVLSVLSGLALLHRACLWLLPDLRWRKLRGSCTDVSEIQLARVSVSVGDWFFLYRLSKNIGVVALNELIHELTPMRQGIDKNSVI